MRGRTAGQGDRRASQEGCRRGRSRGRWGCEHVRGGNAGCILRHLPVLYVHYENPIVYLILCKILQIPLLNLHSSYSSSLIYKHFDLIISAWWSTLAHCPALLLRHPHLVSSRNLHIQLIHRRCLICLGSLAQPLLAWPVARPGPRRRATRQSAQNSLNGVDELTILLAFQNCTTLMTCLSAHTGAVIQNTNCAQLIPPSVSRITSSGAGLE